MVLPKSNRSQLAISVAIVITFVVVVALVWGFGQQLALARQMRTEEIRLEHMVAAEQSRYDGLVAQLEYVKSDEYVEHWARAEAKMAKPGEVIVVLPTDAGEEQQPVGPQPAPIPEPEDWPFWVELWKLVFGP